MSIKPYNSKYDPRRKRQRNQRSNCKHSLDHTESKRIPEKHLLLLHWLHKSLWLMWITTNWKILKEMGTPAHFTCLLRFEMGIPDHFTCFLRNLYASQEATVKTLHGKTNWFKIGKGVCQGCISSCCLFNLCGEYILWNARLESWAGIKIGSRNINNLRYADDTTLMEKSEEELQSHCWRSK